MPTDELITLVTLRYRDLNIQGSAGSITIEAAAQRLMALADIISLLKGEAGWGSTPKKMIQEMQDWQDSPSRMYTQQEQARQAQAAQQIINILRHEKSAEPVRRHRR